MAIATVDVNFPVGTNIDLFDVGLLASGVVSAQTSTSYTVVIGDETIAFSGSGFTYTGGIPDGGTITGMLDSYYGMPQITLQELNVPVSVLNAFIGAGDNSGAQAALFAGNDVITGGPLNDLFRGYAGADTLNGGAGDDTLDGGTGGDTIVTGGGADVIVVGQGQSLPGSSDVVSDWNSSDAVQFAHVPTGATYAEATAADYGAAANIARDLISTGAVNVVAVAVGNDVAIYADTADDNGSADDVIILTGRTLADVSASNFGLTDAPVAVPPPVTSPGVYLQGTPVADTLVGGAGADTIDGGVGGDTIFTGGGADVIVIGQGQSPNVYGANDGVMDWSSADSVRFAHGAATASEYAEATSGSFAQAALLANQLISSGAVNVVAVAVGGDLAVYADSADDNGVADDVVFLAGRTLADVSYANFATSGGTTTPPPVAVPPPAAPTGLKLDAASDSGVKGDGITNVSQFHMTGVAEKGASVSLYDGTKLIGVGQADAATGAFDIAPTTALTDGAHTLSAVAANSAGAGSYSASVNVILDTHASVSDFGGFTETMAGKKVNVTLHGTASDATSSVSSVNVLQDGVSIGSVAPANGAWSVSKTGVTDAVHTYTMQTTDAAGNVGAGSSTLILGSTGADKIVGKATNDIIHGDAGADTLTGGAGADVFVYDALDDALLGKTKTSPLDTITDFQAGTDKLDLSGLGHMTLKGQSAAVSAHAVNWYVSGGDTFVTGDVTGDGKADFIIQLKGSMALSGSDFLLA